MRHLENVESNIGKTKMSSKNMATKMNHVSN